MSDNSEYWENSDNSDKISEGIMDIGLSGGSISSSSIPDFDSISPVYQDDILNAYTYGITNGVDANKTFSPKSLLTRAQVCQLFYNMGWTSPIA